MCAFFFFSFSVDTRENGCFTRTKITFVKSLCECEVENLSFQSYNLYQLSSSLLFKVDWMNGQKKKKKPFQKVIIMCKNKILVATKAASCYINIYASKFRFFSFFALDEWLIFSEEHSTLTFFGNRYSIVINQTFSTLAWKCILF